jgi:hypothetical protein
MFEFFVTVFNHLVDEGVNKVSKKRLIWLLLNIILVMKFIR